MVGWVYFSVVAGVSAGLSGKEDPAQMGYVYAFGAIFFFSLPAAGVAEVMRWRRKKSKTRMQRLQ
ncbi:MAG: hypothetical protein ACREAZ_13415 [Nitrososphaera sp.]